MPGIVLSRDELEALTGYRQPSRMARWLRDRLGIAAPRRADGLPVLTRDQLEQALQGKAARHVAGPKWSKIAA